MARRQIFNPPTSQHRNTTQGSARAVLATERAGLVSRIGELQSQIAVAGAAGAAPGGASDSATLKAEQATRQSQLEQVKMAIAKIDAAAQGGASAGFLQDILSDATGYSLHRFQIVAGTAVLGVIFVASVYNSLKMPEFSTNLLALRGISAGTYIGFKFPEK